MADGRRLTAPVIISGAGVATTSNRLLSRLMPKNRARDCLTRVDSSAAHLCAYLGFEESTEDLGLQPANWWYYPPVMT